jgi:type II secretory pathway pseudopilin PulG
MVRVRRRLLALLVPLTILAVLAASGVLWMDQQSARARLAEAELQPALARAEAAEARALQAEASLTAIAEERVAEAAATATAVSAVNEPQRALERNLGRLFAVFQEPTGAGYEHLGDYFGSTALQTLRAEADYLRATGRHLGGASTFSVNASPPQQVAPDRAQVHTIERWLYDERDESEGRQRCFVEDSDQTYTLKLTGQVWTIDEFQLSGTRRSDCPPGT